MELCPKCKNMSAEYTHYNKKLICSNRSCNKEFKQLNENELIVFELTWKDGIRKFVKATTSEAAINMCGKGMPATIAVVREKNENFEIFQLLLEIENKIEKIREKLKL